MNRVLEKNVYGTAMLKFKIKVSPKCLGQHNGSTSWRQRAQAMTPINKSVGN